MTPQAATLADLAAFRQRMEATHSARSIVAPGAPRGPWRPASNGDVTQPQSMVYFDALGASPNRTTIPSIPYDVAGVLGGYGYAQTFYREQLAAISRYIVDNYGMAWLAVSMTADYSVPVIPRGATKNPTWNEEADDLFDAWMERCDFHGFHDYETLQRLACMAIDVDGDIGALMDGQDGEPLLRFVPGWKIGRQIYSGSGVVPEGVIVDASGRLQGFEVVVAPNVTKTFTKDQMMLLLEPERIERMRGMSALRRGSNDLRDANDLKAFEKLAQKIDSAIPGVIEGGAQMTQADWEDPNNPSPGMKDKPRPSSLTLAQMFAGEIPVIEGGTWKQFTQQRDAAGKLVLMDKLAGHFVAGCGLPPAFFLDEKLTGPGCRLIIGKAQRRFDNRKKVMKKLAGFCWVRVIADAISRGDLTAEPGWERRTYQMPSLITIDLGDQAQSDREAVARGLKSRQRFHGSQSEDWQDEQDQIMAEDDYILAQIKEQAKKHGIPIEVLLARRGFTQNGIIPQPAADSKNATPDPQANA